MGKRHLFLWYLALISLLILVYFNHFDNGFHFDDTHTVTGNIFIRSLGNICRFFTDANTFSSLPANTSFRPIVTLSLAFDYWLGGGYVPFYFHISTFLLYLVQLGLMYFLFLKVFELSDDNGNPQIKAASGVTLYSFLTANAETINYVIARSDLYSGLFVVMGLIVYSKFVSLRKYGLYMIPVFIGILSKPPAIMFLPILIAYQLLFEEHTSFEDFYSKDFWNSVLNVLKKSWIPIAGTLAMALYIKSMTPSTFVSGAGDVLMYRLTQPYVILLYFKNYFLPTDLSADTDIAVATQLSDPKILIGFCFLSGLLLAAWFLSIDKKTRPVSFGLLWFLLSLLPTSWVPLAEVMNDHRVFFPFIGLTIAVVSIAFSISEIAGDKVFKWREKVLLLVLLIFTGFQGYGVYLRNEVWDNDKSLWFDVTVKSPQNGRGLMNYGVCLMGEGNYQEAEKYFLAAYKLIPEYSYLHTNIAVIKNSLGKSEEAERYFKSAIALGKERPSTYIFYGDWLVKQNRMNEAIAVYESAKSISDADPEVKHKLMDLYLKLNMSTKLHVLVKETLSISPNDPVALRYRDIINSAMPVLETEEAYINLSLMYYEAGKFQMCVNACERALEINPISAGAYNNICSAYNKLKQYKQAIKACEKALKIRPEWELARNNMMLVQNNMKK